MQYFKHFTNMRNDSKIRRLISIYGIEGYGIYNIIVEIISQGISTENPHPFLNESCEDMAIFYHTDKAKIAQVIKYMITQNLLEIDEISQKIACPKIYKFLEQSQTRSKCIRELIATYRDKTSHDCLGPSQTKVIDLDLDLDLDLDQDKDQEEYMPPSEPKKPKPAKAVTAIADQTRFFESYKYLYAKNYDGKQPIINYGKHGKLLKTILASYPIDEALACLKWAMTDNDYVRSQGHGLDCILTDMTFSRFRAKPQAPVSTLKDWGVKKFTCPICRRELPESFLENVTDCPKCDAPAYAMVERLTLRGDLPLKPAKLGQGEAQTEKVDISTPAPF